METLVRNERVRIERIIADNDMQIRACLNEDRIKEFYDIFEKLPPMKLVETNDGKYHLADGFHRYETARRKGVFECSCDIVRGDLKKVLEIAIENNCRGPLTLSISEKRNTVDKTLRYFPERANSWIADMVGVSMQTVESRRTALEGGGAIEKHEKLETRDGRKYPRKVESTIIKSKPEDEISNIISTTAKKATTSEQTAKRSEIDDIISRGSSKTEPMKSGTVSKMFDKSDNKENNINLFVDNIGLISCAVSEDGKNAVGIKQLLGKEASDFAVHFYEFVSDRFFPVSNIVLSNEAMHGLIKGVQSLIVC
jgi:hypothetical protein